MDDLLILKFHMVYDYLSNLRLLPGSQHTVDYTYTRSIRKPCFAMIEREREYLADTVLTYIHRHSLNWDINTHAHQNR